MAKNIKIAAVMLGLFGFAAILAINLTSPNLFSSNSAVVAQEESSSDGGGTEFA